jgi:UDP-N-acetylmuramoyl-tripeptide--D-alanyl-D-alanine ligase
MAGGLAAIDHARVKMASDLIREAGKLRLLGSRLGRRRLARDARNAAWPLLRRLARAYRLFPTRPTRVIAVVGSYGKTTTTAAVRAALGIPSARAGGWNAYGGLALSVLKIAPWRRHAVFEVGIDGPGQMTAYATMLEPDIVVVTTIGSEHHGSLGTLDRTQEEKGRMVRAMRPGGTAVLNGDDPRVCAMAALTGARVVTYGLGPGNDVRAADVRVDWPHGTRLDLHVDGVRREVRLRLLGKVMVYPFLAAVAVGRIEGRPLDDIVAALEVLPARTGRLQPMPIANGAWLIRDDYKSSLETVEVALDLLAELPGRKIAVMGDVSEPPGSQGPIYRGIGERLAAMAHRVIVVGEFQRYRAGATRAGMPPSALVNARHSVRAAWEAVQAELAPGDIVLIKGRDTQRLDRVALALQGRKVGCEVEFCDLKCVRCETCPALTTGPGRALD